MKTIVEFFTSQQKVQSSESFAPAFDEWFEEWRLKVSTGQHRANEGEQQQYFPIPQDRQEKDFGIALA